MSSGLVIPQNYRPYTIRNLITALMNEFTGLKVENYDVGGGSNLIKEITVPITFAPKSKYYMNEKLIELPAARYAKLPAMALTWDSITFNGNRAKSLRDFRTFYNTELQLSNIDRFVTNVNPTPYDLGFSLEIRTESMNHFTQLLEMILPYFDPARFLRVKEFSFLNLERNIKVRLDGVTQDFLVEQEQNNLRYVRGSLQMTAEAYLYHDLSDVGVISEIRTRIYSGSFGDVLSAVGGNNTSGWDSSSAFPSSAYDVSGTYSNGKTFDYYIDYIL